MCDSMLRGNLRVPAGPIRTKYRIVGHQGLHRTLQGRSLSVCQSFKQARTASVSNSQDGQLPLWEAAMIFSPCVV